MELHERPGVYASYSLSSIWASRAGQKHLGIVARYASSESLHLSSIAQAAAALSGSPSVLGLVRLAFLGGAASVLLYPAAGETASDYQEAAELLLGEKTVRLLICDSEDTSVHAALGRALMGAAENGNECMGIVGRTGNNALQTASHAKILNCERLVLVSGDAKLDWTEEIHGGIYSAAAFAGFLAGETDPALPAHGAALSGLCGIAERFTESEIDQLVQAGVTVLEESGGYVSAIRAVTTRTMTGEEPDNSLRELTTMMILDDVIPGIRSALKSRFGRKKNNTATRGAIRTQVTVELESRLKREIIDSYGDISVEADPADPTICVVSFSVAISHGLSRIYLTAHITV